MTSKIVCIVIALCVFLIAQVIFSAIIMFFTTFLFGWDDEFTRNTELLVITVLSLAASISIGFVLWPKKNAE